MTFGKCERIENTWNYLLTKLLCGDNIRTIKSNDGEHHCERQYREGSSG